MISAALSAGFRVFKTPKNNNGQLGVPVTLSKITGDDEIAVIGKGHEDYQEIEGVRHHFVDREVVDEAVAERIKMRGR